MAKYTHWLMEQLFTQEEMLVGVIETKSVERGLLDATRVDLVKKALFNKFKVNSNEQAACWKNYKKIANRHCYDTEKRMATLEKNKTK